MINEFEIKSPKVVFVLFVILTVILGLAFAGFLLLYFAFSDFESEYTFLIAAICCLPFLALCYIGFFVYNKEKFIFRNEIYTYIKPFRARQSVAACDIGWVEIKGSLLFTVKIYDKFGNIAMNFLDDGTAFRGDLFINSLRERNITINFI